ncbi:MAG: ABC transporter ATP-binding protein [Eubacterium sp.]|nr:ABC transporter ATP-binding protein [Eubacterium sp.]
MSFIRVKSLNKFFGEKDSKIHVLKDVNLEIQKGEFLVILGESGGGKSTLLNIVGGLDRASKGAVFWDDVDICKLSEKELTNFRKKHMGFVFQYYNLIPTLTTAENIEIATELTNSPLDITELIDKVGLKGKENTLPSKLSGGEQQRVSICRALSKNPDVIFCDEPTGALDFETGIKILELLLEMNIQYNKTIVLITHNQPIAEMASRVVRIRSGKIIEIKENETRKLPCELQW